MFLGKCWPGKKSAARIAPRGPADPAGLPVVCSFELEEMAMVSFAERASVPSHVLVRFLEQECDMLNAHMERSFALTATGTRTWQVITAAPTNSSAYERLLEEYDVDGQLLRADLNGLLERLIENGLLSIRPADVGTASPV